MKIGLIDADMMWRPKSNGRRYGNGKAGIFPNLALMKISAWWKAQGHEAGWYNTMDGRYDKVYISKVFSTTPISREVINADNIFYGGSGFNIRLDEGREVWDEEWVDKDVPKEWIYTSKLTDEMEHMMPDYSLYPDFKDTAIGFLTRGCPRGCPFCHVEAKEGRISRKVADLKEWWNGEKNIILCDPNILACKDWRDLLQQLADSGAKVDINQGMDARLLTREKVEMLNKIKLKTIHFAWDDYRQKDKVLKGLETFKKYYKRKFEKGHQAQVFVLTNFDTTAGQDLERVYTLREMGFEPYIMVYDKWNAEPFYKSLQRWVNNRAIFHKIERFEDYAP